MNPTEPYWDAVRSVLTVKTRADDPSGWDAVLAAAVHVPVGYLQAMVAYQAAYHRERQPAYEDLSCVLYDGGQPVAIWPLAVAEGVGSNGGPVLPPLFSGATQERTRKRVCDLCLECLAILCGMTGQPGWTGREVVGPSGVSLWHRRLMERGAAVEVGHELYVDLALPLEAVRLNVRKSYRPLITKGADLWRVAAVGPGEGPGVVEAFDEFRELHRTVSGRTTRGRETWDLQLAAITGGQAFLVTERESAGRLVGAALYYASRTEGLYASAAYNRDLEAQGFPLGHVTVWRAIEACKSLRCRWLDLGVRPYAGPEKEQSIGYFKEGFATHEFIRLTTENPV